MLRVTAITEKLRVIADTEERRGGLSVLRLDYLSCILTISSTILIGKRRWEGWVLAAVNSVVVCFIGLKTAQIGFIPANIFCIGIYAYNLHTWRKADPAEATREPKVSPVAAEANSRV